MKATNNIFDTKLPVPPPLPISKDTGNAITRTKINKRRFSSGEYEKQLIGEEMTEVYELYDLLSSSFVLMANDRELRVHGRKVNPDKNNPSIKDCICVAEIISKVLMRKKVTEKYGGGFATEPIHGVFTDTSAYHDYS
jgi:hypothetical protein